MKDWMALLRMNQWIKNLFVLAPVFFAFEFGQCESMLAAFWAMLAFCLGSSAVYILNDWNDRKDDAEHPVKCKRPIASGRVNKTKCIVVCLSLLVGTLMLGWVLVPTSLPYMGAYLILNVNYTLWMRNVALLDVTSIALGFVLRVLAGAAAVMVPATHWIILMTFLLALFIALGKRRDDVVALDHGKAHRRSIYGYNRIFVDASMTLMGAVITVSYLLYTLSADVATRLGGGVYGTTLFVLLGLLRYLQLALVLGKTGNPTSLVYHDRFLQVVLVGWVTSFFVLFGLNT